MSHDGSVTLWWYGCTKMDGGIHHQGRKGLQFFLHETPSTSPRLTGISIEDARYHSAVMFEVLQGNLNWAPPWYREAPGSLTVERMVAVLITNRCRAMYLICYEVIRGLVDTTGCASSKQLLENHTQGGLFEIYFRHDVIVSGEHNFV